jgi:hypothetical protein
MNTSGHINISQFGHWYRTITFSIHPDPLTGFNFVDSKDADRYKKECLNVYISREIPEHLTNFFNNYFTWLKNTAYSIQKLEPGMLLPWHTDAYTFFRKKNGVDNTNEVIRVIVFLEDWQTGHISEVDTTVNTKYKAGDWISWTGLTPHLAANLGHTDRYTLQITGTAK